MDDRTPTIYLSGMGFRIAHSPEELIAASGPSWSFPRHWPDDPLEAVTDAWPQSLGLAFETGGALLLEAIGEGVYQMVGAMPAGDPDAPLKLQAGIMLAFCGTDCRRLLVQAGSESDAELGRAFGLYRYGVQTFNDGERETVHYLAANLDEYAAALGLPVFHVEARRLGMEDKALRVIERFTRHTGDTTALDFSYLQEVDPAHWRVDVAQVKAARAGFEWGIGSTHWIEHDEGCGVPAGAKECTCSPVIGFTNGHQTATVQPGGEVSIAAHH